MYTGKRVKKDKNDVYKPTITYNVSDSSKKTDMELKYCINTTGKISFERVIRQKANPANIETKI